MTTDEMPKIKGDAQFRLLNGDANIVGNMNDDQSASGAFSYQQAAGSKWTGSISVGKEATRNTDVLHMAFGGNQPHNNIQPSIGAYCWKRTA